MLDFITKEPTFEEEKIEDLEEALDHANNQINFYVSILMVLLYRNGGVVDILDQEREDCIRLYNGINLQSMGENNAGVSIQLVMKDVV